MKKLLVVFLTLAVFFPKVVFAHPGRTASDGCHYCRTNCDKWGVPWNERHCHGSPRINTNPTATPYQAPVVVIPSVQPISTPIPTPTPILPTSTPTPTPTPTPTIVPTAFPTPTNTPMPTFTPLPTVIPTNSPTPTPIQSIAPTEKPQSSPGSKNKPKETRQKQIQWWRLTPFTQLVGLWFNWK